MHVMARTSAILSLSIVCICACQAGTQTPSQLKIVSAPQGGKIAYDAAPGDSTQPAALARLLSTVHASCGEKPQIGRPFQFVGTNSVGVFFTVTDHPEGDLPLAGLVIATAIGTNQVQAAMIYDKAARFGTTVNPMLQQLSGILNPGGASTTTGGQPPAPNHSASSPARAATSGAPAPLHLFTAPDRSASVGIPDGWQAQAQGGTMMLTHSLGPNSLEEIVQLNLSRLAVDPRAQRFGNNQGKIVYPANVDLVRAFPQLFTQFWQLNKISITDLQLDHAEMMAGAPGQRCVHATGHAKMGIPISEEINALICTTAPGPMGNYMFSISLSLLPPAVADRDRATVGAILASFQPNQAVIASEASQTAAPAIAAIHAIGQQATARMAATEAANDEQHASWNAQQDTNARNVQGFTNYLLDQSVIQNNYTGAQGTAWNSTANALVQGNPNKYSYVPTQDYIPGVY